MGKPKRGDKNLHHIVGKSGHPDFNVHIPMNKKIVDHHRHDIFNCLFHNNQDPKSQLKVMRNEWRYPVLGAKAQELFEALLNMKDEDFYKPELLKDGKTGQ